MRGQIWKTLIILVPISPKNMYTIKAQQQQKEEEEKKAKSIKSQQRHQISTTSA